jgi:matrixin
MRATARILACAAAACACVFSQRAEAYLLFTEMINGRQVSFHWNRSPVRYFVTDRGVPGVTLPQLQTAIDKSFRVWQDVPTASITFQAAGVTGASPFEEDGITALGFLSRPDLEGVLGATGFIVDEITGEIIESDIFFNSQYPWSVAESGEPGKVDLESVVVHEIGHLLGLKHSGLGQIEGQGDRRRLAAAEAVMFPIAFDAGTICGFRKFWRLNSGNSGLLI